MYFASTPPEELTDFTGRTGHEFTIAGVVTPAPGSKPEYRVFNLDYLNSEDVDLSGITFLLPVRSITINVGDIHRAKVLEEHGDWQLVAFNYSNTRTSTSIYRAYSDRIEPVSYKLTSHVGQMFSAIILIVPVLIISTLITVFQNWRVKRASRGI
jgi:hypothetical protein